MRRKHHGKIMVFFLTKDEQKDEHKTIFKTQEFTCTCEISYGRGRVRCLTAELFASARLWSFVLKCYLLFYGCILKANFVLRSRKNSNELEWCKEFSIFWHLKLNFRFSSLSFVSLSLGRTTEKLAKFRSKLDFNSSLLLEYSHHYLFWWSAHYDRLILFYCTCLQRRRESSFYGDITSRDLGSTPTLVALLCP